MNILQNAYVDNVKKRIRRYNSNFNLLFWFKLHRFTKLHTVLSLSKYSN